MGAPSLTEFKEHLDNALRHRVGFRACPAQDQELDWMIPVGPFQLWIFYDSVISTQASIIFTDTEQPAHPLPATAPGTRCFGSRGMENTDPCINLRDLNPIPWYQSKHSRQSDDNLNIESPSGGTKGIKPPLAQCSHSGGLHPPPRGQRKGPAPPIGAGPVSGVAGVPYHVGPR